MADGVFMIVRAGTATSISSSSSSSASQSSSSEDKSRSASFEEILAAIIQSTPNPKEGDKVPKEERLWEEEKSLKERKENSHSREKRRRKARKEPKR